MANAIKKLAAVVACGAPVALTTTAHAQSVSTEIAQSRAYVNNNNLPSSGLALEGYCPVAYFAVNKPVRGDQRFASTYRDVTYHFVNADAKRLFDKNPEKYVPAYGGWCAFGMAISDKFPVDPTNFKIVDGRLNLFLRNKNVDALNLWSQGDEQAHMAKAAAHWKKVNE